MIMLADLSQINNVTLIFLKCKKLYFCKIYNQVLKNNENPTTYYSFENALINALGIAVEKKESNDFMAECKFYYQLALIGIHLLLIRATGQKGNFIKIM